MLVAFDLERVTRQGTFELEGVCAHKQLEHQRRRSRDSGTRRVRTFTSSLRGQRGTHASRMTDSSFDARGYCFSRLRSTARMPFRLAHRVTRMAAAMPMTTQAAVMHSEIAQNLRHQGVVTEMGWSKRMYWTCELHCGLDPNVLMCAAMDIDQARYTETVVI